VGGTIKRAVWELLELLVPPVCCHCLRPCRHDEHGLCRACRRGVVRSEPPFCHRCAVPIRAVPEQESALCPRCADHHTMPRVRAYAQFAGDVLPSLMVRCKYGGEQHLGRSLGELVWAAAKTWLQPADYDGVVAVPLHDRRVLKRGFNQSVLLAGPLCRGEGLPLLSVLRRVDRTAAQVGLGAEQRSHNLRGSFVCPATHRTQVQGRRLLLVDDVVTTGWTVTECALELRRAGALQVDVVCLARTPQQRLGS